MDMEEQRSRARIYVYNNNHNIDKNASVESLLERQVEGRVGIGVWNS